MTLRSRLAQPAPAALTSAQVGESGASWVGAQPAEKPDSSHGKFGGSPPQVALSAGGWWVTGAVSEPAWYADAAAERRGGGGQGRATQA